MTNSRYIFPVAIALLDTQGQSIPLSIGRPSNDGVVLDLTQAEQEFIVEGLTAKPVLSILRHFSAPVKLEHDVSDDTLVFLASHDSDGFNRWEAIQRLAHRCITAVLDDQQPAAITASDRIDNLIPLVRGLLQQTDIDTAFLAEALTLPSLDTLAEQQSVVDILSLDDARQQLARRIAEGCKSELQTLLQTGQQSRGDDRSEQAMGSRRAGNAALDLLASLPASEWQLVAFEHYQQADNMTDRMAALRVLCHGSSEAREICLRHFHDTWHTNPQVLDNGLQCRPWPSVNK